MKRILSTSGALILTISITYLSYVTPLALTNSASKPNYGSVIDATPMKRNAFLRTLAISGTAVLGAGTGIVTPTLPANADPLPQTGTKAPDFSLPDSKGGQTGLSDLIKTGKWTVLYFYPGAFTNGCTLEARGFQRDIDKFRSLNTQVVGVSVDEVQKNASFCMKEKLDFYVLSDKNGSVSKLYGSAVSIPGFGTFSNRQTYLVDPTGNLRWVFTDVEDRVTKHSAEVIDKLEELRKA